LISDYGRSYWNITIEKRNIKYDIISSKINVGGNQGNL
jgi:hypothetical protein